MYGKIINPKGRRKKGGYSKDVSIPKIKNFKIVNEIF